MKDKQSRVVFDTEVMAEFLNPLLDLSSTSLTYDYTWDPNLDIAPISQPLTLTNKTPLPLDFVLKTSVPFAVDVWEHSLAPQESTEINVEFDPSYKTDRSSHVADAKVRRRSKPLKNFIWPTLNLNPPPHTHTPSSSPSTGTTPNATTSP